MKGQLWERGRMATHGLAAHFCGGFRVHLCVLSAGFPDVLRQLWLTHEGFGRGLVMCMECSTVHLRGARATGALPARKQVGVNR